MDAIAADLGLDRTDVRERNFIQPDEMPFDQGLIFQDGRRAGLRLRRLPGVAGQAQGAGRLGRLPDVPDARPRRRDAGSGSGWPATSRAPASAPTRAPTSASRPTARVVVVHRAHLPGPGPRRRCSRRSSPTSSACRSRTITVTTGDTRRFKYAVGTFASRTAVMSGSAVAT